MNKVLDAVDKAINVLMVSGRSGLLCANELNIARPTIAALYRTLYRYRDAHDAVQANPARLLSDPASWDKCAAGMAELEAARNALLAFIPEQRCTCPSGDGSLRWPCPKHMIKETE